jgi:hypothetical protein
MLSDSKRKATGYWEKRRIIYNCLLVPVSWFAWQVSCDFTYHIDDRAPASLADPRVWIAILFLFIAVNICYSFVYVLEFFFLNENPGRFWPFPGRTIFLIVGCILGMLIVTRVIGQIEVDHAGPGLPYDP